MSFTQTNKFFPDFTNRALGHRMDALRNMADKYLSTMALQANAEATSTQANVSSPAKENKRGPGAATPKSKAKSTTTAKTSATKEKAAKNSPLKATTNAGVKKRGAPASKAKTGTKTDVKGKQAEEAMQGDDEDHTDATITDMEAEMQDELEDVDTVKMECA